MRLFWKQPDYILLKCSKFPFKKNQQQQNNNNNNNKTLLPEDRRLLFIKTANEVILPFPLL